MRLFYTLIACFLTATMVNAQTTEYETGQSTSDAWTGWSTPVVTNVLNSSINGINIYNFTLESSGTYSIEITRSFTINSADLDFYLNTTSENSTITLSISTDNSNWTSIGNETTTAFGMNQMVVPTINPGAETFYVKIHLTGTIGSNQSAMIQSFKINADLNNPVVSVNEIELNTQLIYHSDLNLLSINTNLNNYTVKVYNISGQQLVSQSNLTTYDFSAFNKGIYFVTIESPQSERKTIKIVR